MNKPKDEQAQKRIDLGMNTPYVHTPYKAYQSKCKLPCPFSYIDHSEPVRNV